MYVFTAFRFAPLFLCGVRKLSCTAIQTRNILLSQFIAKAVCERRFHTFTHLNKLKYALVIVFFVRNFP